MKSAVVFGGGNIGRSFITPVLQEAGYGITIVDIDESLIARLREAGEYTIVIRSQEGESVRMIRDLSCISFREEEQLRAALTGTDLIVSSVGQAGLATVCGLLAEILPQRNERGDHPVDLILAENIRGGADFCRNLLKHSLPRDYPLATQLGLVETSIGKMVPLLTEEDRREDPLRLFAEPYNTLILDRAAFLSDPPRGGSIKLVSPIAAWVDRKLFIHNLGHAAAAYLGRQKYPEKRMIWEVLEDPDIRQGVREAMGEGAAALLAEYPAVFQADDLEEHIRDLLFRFRNKALGDSVQRVGRDLNRKLHRDDRVVGAARLAAAHALPYGHILDVYHAALVFGRSPLAEEADRAVSDLAARRGAEGVFLSLTMREQALSDPQDRDILEVLAGEKRNREDLSGV